MERPPSTVALKKNWAKNVKYSLFECHGFQEKLFESTETCSLPITLQRSA